jgi:F-type H+-transporting ATPase subunit alpha
LDIGRFEDEWLRYMHTEHQDLLDTIRDEKKISDETGEKLKAAADKFSKAFA